MSEALRNFLFLKDPLGKGYSLTVTQAELEALLEAHEAETLAPPEECDRWHCSAGDCTYPED